jgi:hypothetical protein
LKQQIAHLEWEKAVQSLIMRLPVPLPFQGYREVIWQKIKNIWRNEGAIANNGDIKIEFYKERQTYYNPITISGCFGGPQLNTYTQNIGGASDVYPNAFYTTSMTYGGNIAASTASGILTTTSIV